MGVSWNGVYLPSGHVDGEKKKINQWIWKFRGETGLTRQSHPFLSLFNQPSEAQFNIFNAIPGVCPILNLYWKFFMNGFGYMKNLGFSV